MDRPAPHLDRIRKCFPNLAITTVEVNNDGLVNDVLIVNGELVFRTGAFYIPCFKQGSDLVTSSQFSVGSIDD